MASVTQEGDKMQIIKREETNKFNLPTKSTIYSATKNEVDEYKGSFQVSVNSDGRMVIRGSNDNGEDVLICLTAKESHTLKNFLDLKDLPF